jgi:hypothetical protein
MQSPDAAGASRRDPHCGRAAPGPPGEAFSAASGLCGQAVRIPRAVPGRAGAGSGRGPRRAGQSSGAPAALRRPPPIVPRVISRKKASPPGKPAAKTAAATTTSPGPGVRLRSPDAPASAEILSRASRGARRRLVRPKCRADRGHRRCRTRLVPRFPPGDLTSVSCGMPPPASPRQSAPYIPGSPSGRPLAGPGCLWIRERDGFRGRRSWLLSPAPAGVT